MWALGTCICLIRNPVRFPGVTGECQGMGMMQAPGPGRDALEQRSARRSGRSGTVQGVLSVSQGGLLGVQPGTWEQQQRFAPGVNSPHQ